jgi:hypothetical protein
MNKFKILGCILIKYTYMRIPWKHSKENTDNKMHNILDSRKFEHLDTAARYFILDKGCSGDTKTLIKFDGLYWRWNSIQKKWYDDQTITREDWCNGNLRSIPKEEVEKILCS